MKPAVSTLTISFEAPFWVGLYEREEEKETEKNGGVLWKRET